MPPLRMTQQEPKLTISRICYNLHPAINYSYKCASRHLVDNCQVTSSGMKGAQTLRVAQSGGEQRCGGRGRCRSAIADGCRCRGCGSGGELADKGREGLRVGATVAQRHEQRQGVAVEAGVEDLGHLESQLE
jgi:hypothetical protein